MGEVIRPLPILAHMPNFVQKQIVDDCHTSSKVALRSCSKNFKCHVDKAKMTYNRLSVELEEDLMKIHLVIDSHMDRMMEFKPNEEGYLMVNEKENWSKTVDNGHFAEGCAEFLAKILREPQAHFTHFCLALSKVGSNDEFNQNGKKFLVKLDEMLDPNHYISVRFLRFGHHEGAQFLLPYLKPSTLKSLVFDYKSESRTVSRELLQVVGLPQFRLVKHLMTIGFHTTSSYRALEQHQYLDIEIPVLKLRKVRYAIEKFQSAKKRKYVCLRHDRIKNLQEIHDYLTRFEKIDDNKFFRKVQGINRMLKVAVCKNAFVITELEAPALLQPQQ